MSCKFAILLLVAFVGYQSTSASFIHFNGKAIQDGNKEASLFNPLDHPVTFVGKLLNIHPIRVIRKIFIFPLMVILKAIRVVLTPIRVVLLPLHLIHRVVRGVLTPFRMIGRLIMNVLLSLPVIRLVARVCLGIWRLLSFPFRVVIKGFRVVLGHDKP